MQLRGCVSYCDKIDFSWSCKQENTMQFKLLFLFLLLLFTTAIVNAQRSGSSGELSGTVRTRTGEALLNLTITIEGTMRTTQTNEKGQFVFRKLVPGDYTIALSGTSFGVQKKSIRVISGKTTEADFIIEEHTHELNQVTISGASGNKVRQQGFSADIVDARKIANRNVDMNHLMSTVAGVRVRETGGLGSDFNYSINGLSGRAVKFFINGIPMESFGTSYSINNLPINLVERIEVFKGATPVELGGDALGGAINIVTSKNTDSYLDASYSYGSFNTQRAAVTGRWRAQGNGFTTMANVFRNSSDNDYKVSGPTVEIAGPGGNPIPVTARRFNDRYESTSAQAEAGFTGVSWADQLLLGLTGSKLDKGIQTGQTMAYVYGEASYKEKFVMPSVKYSKKDFLTDGLQVDLFSSFNRLEATTVDTSSRRYDWDQHVIEITSGGEIGGIGAQRSMLTFTDKTHLHRLNSSYKISDHHSFNFNFIYSATTRKGSDPFAAEWTIPYRSPQNLSKQVTGLAYQLNDAEQKWVNTFFVKNYNYNAQAQNANSRVSTHSNNWGYGYAGKFILSNSVLVKLSAEKAVRLPEANELLGNGNTILIAPSLQPEISYNANVGAQFSKSFNDNVLIFQPSVFYRNTSNLILLALADYLGRSRYENVAKTEGKGIEAEVTFRRKTWLEVTGNLTYQDIRNNQKYDTNSGLESNIYKDRLRNTPYLMGNAEVRLSQPELFAKSNSGSVYWVASYVHQYYLNWPKLGAADQKSVIPMQFTNDIGTTYSLQNNRYNISLECRNVFDKQVFDNYLLQKPGRMISVKTRYFLSR